MFSLARALLSPGSAEDRSSLFAWFIDSMARSDWMIGAGWHKLVRSQNRVEPHAVQIACPLAVPELFQFSGIGPRQPHRKAAFGGMSSDHEVLHMSPFMQWTEISVICGRRH